MKKIPRTKKRIDTYIRIILEATETTYNNIFYPTAVQEEKIKAATEKFKLKSIQERAKEQKTAKTVPATATAPAPTMTAPAQQDITLSRLQRENKEFMARISELEALTTEQETQLKKIKSQLAQANQENANNKKILQEFADLATSIKGDWYRAGPVKAIQKLAQELLSR